MLRRAAPFLLGLLLPLLVAEAGLRVLAPGLRDPAPWPSLGLEIKADQIDALVEAGAEVDVVLVGSSVTEAAVDPGRLHDRSGLSAYNSAVPFSSPLSMEAWLDDRLWALDPTVLVVGLPIWGADSTAADDPLGRRLEEIRSFETMRRGWAGRSELWVRRRQLHEVLEGSAAAEPLADEYTAHGHLRVYYGRTRPPEANAARLVGRPFPGISADNEAALARIVADAAARDTRVVFLLEPGGCPPVLAGCADAASAEAARAAVAELADRLGVGFVDGRALPLDEAWFADDAHVNELGTEAFTAFLAEQLPIELADQPA